MKNRKIPPTWPTKMPVSDQGISHDRYQLIPRTLIFLTRGESVLLLKGAPDKRIWANRFNGVGGHIEKGEDIYTAARREIMEETGLAVDDLWLAGVVTVDTGNNPGICIYVMRGNSDSGETKASDEGELEWVEIHSIQDKPLVEDLPILLPRVLDQEINDPPFAGRYYYQGENLIVEFGS